MRGYQKIQGFDPQLALSRIENDRELYIELIQIYLEDAPGLVRDLEPAIKTRNFEVASLRSHSLKSTSRTVGAEGLGEVAAEAEQAILHRDWPSAEALIEVIKKLFEQVQMCLVEVARNPEEMLKNYCE